MFLDLAYECASDIRAFARWMHLHPELSMQESKTTQMVRRKLADLGVEVMDIGIEYGVVGIIRSDQPGPLIALRADIDAIMQSEAKDHTDRSLVDGVMHGCGHDIHAAALWGCALLLSKRKHLLCGDVMLIFQPSEETLRGARYLLDKGIFARQRPAAIFGLHNYPGIEAGKVGVKAGTLMSFKDGFRVRYLGKSGHTSTPQANIDPTVAIASLILSLQTIVSRNVGPLESAVVSVCSITAGNPFATTVDDAEITGNIRTLDPSVRQVVCQRLQTIAESTATAYGCKAEVVLTEITPGVINDVALLPIGQQAVCHTLGAEALVKGPVDLASEDFAVLSEGIPSFFYFLGSGFSDRENALWHSADFFAHPDTPVFGAALLAQTVVEFQRIGER